MPLARFDTWVRSAVGPAAAGTQVYICTQPAVTSTIPPSPMASLFSDSGSLTPVTQPLVADGFGHAYGYVSSGTYTVVLVQYGLVQQVFPDQLIGGGEGSSLVLQTNGVPNTVQSLLNIQGAGSVSVSSDGVGGVTITGSAGSPPGGTTGQVQFNNSGVFGGLPTTGSVSVVLSNSPTLVGAPKAPTQSPLDNSTNIATTAYADLAVGVEKNRALSAESFLAPSASPALTGTPTAPTASKGTSTTQIATTAFVSAIVGIPVVSGLLGQYDFNQGAGTTLTDISGNGNNGTFGAGGAAPTWISNTGGLLFSGGQQVTLPSGITSSVKTMIVFCSAQSSIWNSTGYNSPLISSTGNSGATPIGSGIILVDAGVTSSLNLPHSYDIAAWSYPSGIRTLTVAQFLGSGVICLTLDTNARIFTNGQENYYQEQDVLSAGSGVFQFGGGGAGSGVSVDSHFYGSIYYAALYNRVLTNAEINSVTQFVIQQMKNRGISTTETDPSNLSVLLADGDSISSNNAYTQYLSAYLDTTPNWNIENVAKDGAQIVANLIPFGALDVDPGMPSGANSLLFWAGTNDLAIAGLTATQTLAGASAYCTQRRQKGWKVICAPVIARGDESKNTYNPLLRAQWRTFSDGFADIASDPRLGADGAYSNTTYFSDGIHPTAIAQQTISAPLFARAINRMFGNVDFSSATTYTSGASAPTAITAATESSNTVTFTFSSTPASFVIGRPMTVSSVTPSGYNRTDYIILTRSSTQVTCFNPTSSLGAGSVFGAASVPLQQDADVCTILGGSSSSQNFTLETAIGYTGQRLQMKNTNSNSWTVTPWGAETIDGSSSVTVATGATLVLESALVSSSSAGCNWAVVQNAV